MFAVVREYHAYESSSQAILFVTASEATAKAFCDKASAEMATAAQVAKDLDAISLLMPRAKIGMSDAAKEAFWQAITESSLQVREAYAGIFVTDPDRDKYDECISYDYHEVEVR